MIDAYANISHIDTALKAFEATVDELRGQGIDTLFLVAALAELAARITRDDPNSIDHLQSLIVILKAHVEARRSGQDIDMARALFEGA